MIDVVLLTAPLRALQIIPPADPATLFDRSRQGFLGDANDLLPAMPPDVVLAEVKATCAALIQIALLSGGRTHG
jgi:hypothetical protein